MRDIKFRVWDGEKIISLSKATYLDIVCIQYNRDDCFKIEPVFCDVKIMQFTGLTDKSGVEIYEGDILSGESKVFGVTCGKVEFSKYEDSEEYVHCLHYGWNIKGIPLVDLIGDGLKLIGNIYENPELIGE